jgi:hypothetical protein
VKSHRFLWRVQKDGSADGINHDKSFRLRRQDRDLTRSTERTKFAVV